MSSAWNQAPETDYTMFVNLLKLQTKVAVEEAAAALASVQSEPVDHHPVPMTRAKGTVELLTREGELALQNDSEAIVTFYIQFAYWPMLLKSFYKNIMTF